MNNAPSLPELQRQFAAAVAGGTPAALLDTVSGKGLDPAARLQIYRNIVHNNHAAALRTAYPAVLKLVGEDFFESVAARYFRDRPTSTGNLQDYGADFPDYLTRLPEVSGLAYLPDIALLEWARQESILATDAEPVSITEIAKTTQPDHLRITLHPSLRLVSSAHPVLDIWRFCQETDPGNLELSGKSQNVLVWRDGPQIAMQEIDAGVYAFIAALLSTEPLVAAHETALQAAKDFDLSQCLHWLFTNGLVTDLTNDIH
ncbi:MAG: putative DNA-binding domain-containing protein [Gammaproteobacteria bacterium]|nr:putative DNA-binding domain-containing protein [Gammaproteobacteria bacterium]MDE2345907.1 putative DNA-binding domain-containing protein [Gammaproteobacteria bacterium]